MDKTRQTIDQIIENLTRMQLLLKNHSRLKLYDLNIIAEGFIANLLNAFWDTNLRNLNHEDKNIPSIDLGDDQARIAVQVTSSRSSKKVQKTIDKFIQYGFKNKYDRLFVFILADKQKSYSSVDTKCLSSFNENDNILDFGSLIDLLPLNINKLSAIKQVLDNEVTQNDPELKAFSHSDQDVLEIYKRFFNRPALQDPFRLEGDYRAFEYALTELIELLNTGCVKNKRHTKPYCAIKNYELKNSIENLYHNIRGLRNLYKEHVLSGEIDPNQKYTNFKNQDKVRVFDILRQDIIDSLNKELANFNLSQLHGVGLN